MKYFPLSEVARHPSMPASYAWELDNALTRRPSQHAMHAAHQVTGQMQPCGATLAIIETLGCSMRFTYTDCPSMADWWRLERIGFVDTGTAFFILVDALH